MEFGEGVGINGRVAALKGAIERAGRGRDVRLLAVSKGRSAGEVETGFGTGLVDFGENYLQEAMGKMSALGHLPLGLALCRGHPVQQDAGHRQSVSVGAYGGSGAHCQSVGCGGSAAHRRVHSGEHRRRSAEGWRCAGAGWGTRAPCSWAAAAAVAWPYGHPETPSSAAARASSLSSVVSFALRRMAVSK